MTALSEFPDLHEVPADPAEREAFRLDSLGKATWAMRKCAELEDLRAEIRKTAQAEIERIQAWAAAEDAKLEPSSAWFESLLRAYALERRAADPRQKSLSTPYGFVKTAARVAWEVDSEAVIEWARTARPDWVKVKVTESLALAEAKKVLKPADGGAVDPATGESVPGVVTVEDTVTAILTVIK